MLAECGDVVQIDGGLVIVTAVKDDKATVAAVSDFKGKKPHALTNGINRQITNDRLFERRGKAGLDEFLLEQATIAKHKSKGLIKLEPGDKLCHGGEWRTVTEVTEKWSTIGSLDGQVFMEDRLVNEFLLTECCTHKLIRLNAEERAENLKQFLSQRKSPLRETETSDATETQHIETMKATKTKTKKATKAKRPKPAKAAVVKTEAKPGQWTGISALVTKLVTSGVRGEELLEKVRAKYPGAGKSWLERQESRIIAKAKK